ncbi:MAG: hypothetical protein QOD95_1281 [Gammaproteobacteria bacterium]|jgi:hypothetical protein|nr:hypothetical protein [Gammaproteobacteria bacterium]
MRLILCLIPLLCGCSAPIVRCDAHLVPINPPAAGGAASALGGTPGTAAQNSAARRAP